LESFERSKEKLIPWIEMCKQSLLQKRKVLRWEANPQLLAWQTWDVSVMLPGRLGNKFRNKIHGWLHSHFLL